MKNAWLRYIMMCVVTLTLIAPLLGGCGGRVTEPKLVRADSLMDAAPDSALALLLTIDSTRLDGRANQAYYALLLTQARYKCYIPATGDSLINIAVDYYRHHGPYEQRIRSVVFKGCVSEELNHQDEAMQWYKEAEHGMSDTLTYWKGYVNLRIAQLYQTYYIADSSAIEHYQTALNNFQQREDLYSQRYSMICTGEIGALSGTKPRGYTQSLKYLEKAVRMAWAINDSSYAYKYMSKLSLLHYYHNDIMQAKNIAMEIINNAHCYVDDHQYYNVAIWSYSKLGRSDSARIIYTIKPKLLLDVDTLNDYHDWALISRAEGDELRYCQLKNKYDSMASVMLFNNMQLKLADIEEKYDNQLLNAENQRIKNQNFRMLLSLGALALLTLFLAYVYQKLKGKYQLHVIESQNIRLELSQAQIELDRMVKKNTDATRAEEELKGLAATSFVVSELMKRMKVNPKNKSEYATKNKTIFQIIDSLIKEQMLSFDNLDEQFWQSLYIAVNYKCLGIVTYVKEKYPHLTEKDLHLLALCCSDFSVPVISQCLGYTNVKTLSNNKIKFMREKLGLNQTLADFKSDYIIRMRKNRVSHKSV